jgi:hypothetical protein
VIFPRKLIHYILTVFFIRLAYGSKKVLILLSWVGVMCGGVGRSDALVTWPCLDVNMLFE